LLVGTSSKPVERTQPSLSESPETKLEISQLVEAAISGMAMTDRIFVAEVDSHCNNSNEFGSCQIHLTKAVSYGG